PPPTTTLLSLHAALPILGTTLFPDSSYAPWGYCLPPAAVDSVRPTRNLAARKGRNGWPTGKTGWAKYGSCPTGCTPSLWRFAGPDRKSTRLNSSHLGISY